MCHLYSSHVCHERLFNSLCHWYLRQLDHSFKSPLLTASNQSPLLYRHMIYVIYILVRFLNEFSVVVFQREHRFEWHKSHFNGLPLRIIIASDCFEICNTNGSVEKKNWNTSSVSVSRFSGNLKNSFETKSWQEEISKACTYLWDIVMLSRDSVRGLFKMFEWICSPQELYHVPGFLLVYSQTVSKLETFLLYFLMSPFCVIWKNDI